jgi:hypothetical protein
MRLDFAAQKPTGQSLGLVSPLSSTLINLHRSDLKDRHEHSPERPVVPYFRVLVDAAHGVLA